MIYNEWIFVARGAYFALDNTSDSSNKDLEKVSMNLEIDSNIGHVKDKLFKNFFFHGFKNKLKWFFRVRCRTETG